ncbi:TPA: restriction endonuclease [Enterococcus faecium]
MNNIDSVLELMKHNSNYLKKEILFTAEQSAYINSIIEKIYEDKFNDLKEKGAALEELISAIFVVHKLFESKANINTNTNEIDIVLNLTELGNIFNVFLFNNLINQRLIVECKNHKSKLGVDYVGKFASLLIVSKSNMGLFITKNGITGRSNWEDSKGLVRKISLRENISILDFELKDFKDLYDIDILTKISQKKEILDLDVDYTNDITYHPFEEEILKLK